MHYLKRLVTVFLLAAFFSMEMAFNATPPANAQVIHDEDCVLHAVGAATGFSLPQVLNITNLMVGPSYDGSVVGDALAQLGAGRITPETFYTRGALDTYLNTTGNAEYIVGWRRFGDSVGHVINARVIDRIVEWIDNQNECVGSAAEPAGNGFGYTYTVWLTRRLPLTMNGLSFLFTNLTIDDLAKRNVTYGNFTGSCKNIALFTNVDRFNSVDLSAECQDDQGNFQPTGININPSIINDSGALAWQANGGFGASVQNCQIQVNNYTILECDAANGSGSSRKAGINLDTEIVNRNGKLTVLDDF